MIRWQKLPDDAKQREIIEAGIRASIKAGIKGYSLEIILEGTHDTCDLAELIEEQAEELLKEFKSRDLTEWWSKLKNQ